MKKQSLFVALMAGVMCLFAACNLYTDDPEKKKKDSGTEQKEDGDQTDPKDPQPANNTITYEGIVKELNRSTPIPGVIIKVYDGAGSDANLLASDTTDSKGAYKMEVPHDVDPDAPNAEWKNYISVYKPMYFMYDNPFYRTHKPSDLGKSFDLNIYLREEIN